MVAITNVVLLAAGATASVMKRDFAKVQSDLQKTNTDTTTLKNLLTNWDGTVAKSVPIQNAFSTVDGDVKNTTTDANASSVVTDTQAQTIIDYINNTLEPNVAGTVTAAINKKSQFSAVGLQQTVCNNFKTLQTDENALGSALIAKTPSTKTSAANAAQSKVAADIQKGVTAFC